METDDCQNCTHHRDAHWWQEPSHPEGGILRCKTCEATGQACLASYPGNPLPAPPRGIVLCTTLNPDEEDRNGNG